MPPRIAIPLPTSTDPEYNDRAWPQYARAVELAGGEPVAVPLNEPPAATARLLASCSAILLPGSGADVNPQKYGATPDPHSAAPDPARENVDELLLQDAHNLHKPIFAICFGTQMLNVWRGGTLIQDLPTARPDSTVNHKAGRTVPEAHPTEIAPNSLLAEVLAPTLAKAADSQPDIPAGLEPPHPSENHMNVELTAIRLSVNSSHHQAIESPGDALRVVARSPEDGVIEAIEGTLGANPSNSFILGVQWHPERTYDSSPASRALFARFIAEASAWSPREPQVS